MIGGGELVMTVGVHGRGQHEGNHQSTTGIAGVEHEGGEQGHQLGKQRGLSW